MKSFVWASLVGLPLIVGILGCHAGSASQGSADAPDEAGRTLQVIGEGYQSNREAFENFTCWFEVTRGTASSIEDAVEGRIRDKHTCKIMWMVKGKKNRYELSYEVGDVKKTLASTRRSGAPVEVTSPFFPMGYLTDGSVRLRFSPVMRAANIAADGNRLKGIDLTPFNPGTFAEDEQFSPGGLIKACQEGRYIGQLEGQKNINGRNLLAVSFRQPSKTPCFRFLLDPSRGFLPIQHEHVRSETQEASGRCFVTEVKQTSQEWWFPMRVVDIFNPDRKNSTLGLTEVRVTRLDVENTPKDSDFYLDIPKGTTIAEPADLRKVIGLRENQRVKVEDLGRVLARLRALPVDAPNKAGRLLEAPTTNWSWRLVGGGVVLAVISAAILVRRRLRMRAG